MVAAGRAVGTVGGGGGGTAPREPMGWASPLRLVQQPADYQRSNCLGMVRLAQGETLAPASARDSQAVRTMQRAAGRWQVGRTGQSSGRIKRHRSGNGKTRTRRFTPGIVDRDFRPASKRFNRRQSAGCGRTGCAYRWRRLKRTLQRQGVRVRHRDTLCPLGAGRLVHVPQSVPAPPRTGNARDFAPRLCAIHSTSVPADRQEIELWHGVAARQSMAVVLPRPVVTITRLRNGGDKYERRR